VIFLEAKILLNYFIIMKGYFNKFSLHEQKSALFPALQEEASMCFLGQFFKTSCSEV
jgi:hypothetical protein